MRAAGIALALGLAVGSGAVPAQADASHAQRMREGLELRVATAKRAFADWSAAAPVEGEATALASFAAHLPPGRIRELLAECACEPLQLYRTIGEMQIGVGGDPRKVFAADADRALGNDLAQGLAFSLDPSKGLPTPHDPSPLERERAAKARRAQEAVMRQAQAGRPMFTGVLLRASAHGLRTLSRSADVLAIEIAYGSARNFPVTIDLLEAAR